jgi:hypothetical protein
LAEVGIGWMSLYVAREQRFHVACGLTVVHLQSCDQIL